MDVRSRYVRLVTSEPAADREHGLTVVLVAHGSRAPEANEAHRQMAVAVAAEVGLPVVPAFLELAEPAIPDAIVAAVDAGAARVLVLPHFLYLGRHVATDIPALVAEARARRSAAVVELLDPSGADPRVTRLLAAQIRRAQ